MPITTTSTHALRALLNPRYLVSRQPWQSLAYVVTTVLVATPLAGALWVLTLPWLVAWRAFSDGRLPNGPVLVLMVAGLLAFTVLGPPVAVLVATIERWRLALMGVPARSGHRAASGGVLRWLRVRYAEAATWREVLYVLFLAAAVPLGYFTLILLALVDATLLAGPLIAAQSSDLTFVFGPYEVKSVADSIPAALVGLGLLPILLYLIGLMAALQATVATVLLSDDGSRLPELLEVQRSRTRLVDAFEADRRRLQRDLHDGIQHQLASLTLHLGVARLDLPMNAPAAEALRTAHDQAKEMMVMLRNVVHGIRPQTLTDLGLPAAVRELAGKSAIPVTVSVDDSWPRLPDNVEITAYYVAAEALTNVAKHAAAQQVELRACRQDGMLVLEIGDDGRGGANQHGGSGLTGLADRLGAVGGRLKLGRSTLGGTLVRAELPWNA